MAHRLLSIPRKMTKRTLASDVETLESETLARVAGAWDRDAINRVTRLAYNLTYNPWTVILPGSASNWLLEHKVCAPGSPCARDAYEWRKRSRPE